MMLTPYRLAVIDLDDTLLGPSKEISPENLHALDQLRGAGVQIVIASGRHHLNILNIAKHYQLLGWIISSQGALVEHSETGEIIYERTIPPDVLRELLLRAPKERVSQLAYHRTGVFIESESEWTRLYTSRAGHSPRQADFRVLAESGLEKLLWSESAERIERLAPQLMEEYRGRLYVVVTEHEIVEFCAPEVNKARGAQAVAQKLSCDSRQVLAFGDGNNDVPMLEWAGCSVAMHHGRASAKAAAKIITPPGPPETAFARGVEGLLDLF